MKKFFYLLVILLFGCSNADDAFFTKEEIARLNNSNKSLR